MKRLIKLFLILTCISCTDKQDDTDRWTKLDQSREVVSDELKLKYNIKYELDDTNFKFSINYNDLLNTEAQLIKNGFRLNDIYQKDTLTYVSVFVGVPRKFITLKISYSDLEVLMSDSSSYIIDKILVIKLEEIRKIDFTTKIFPDEFNSYDIRLNIGRDFIGRGRIIEIADLAEKR